MSCAEPTVPLYRARSDRDPRHAGRCGGDAPLLAACTIRSTGACQRKRGHRRGPSRTVAARPQSHCQGRADFRDRRDSRPRAPGPTRPVHTRRLTENPLAIARQAPTNFCQPSRAKWSWGFDLRTGAAKIPENRPQARPAQVRRLAESTPRGTQHARAYRRVEGLFPVAYFLNTQTRVSRAACTLTTLPRPRHHVIDQRGDIRGCAASARNVETAFACAPPT